MDVFKVADRACPICLMREARVIHTQAFAAPVELQAPPSYDVVSCLTCGFAYADQSVSQATLDVAYAAHSKYVTDLTRLTDSNPPTDPPWDVERLENVALYLSLKLSDRSIRILDAGCSSGTFLAAMKRKGFTNLVGLDPSPAAVATAVDFNEVEAVVGSFVNPPPIGRFDVITLSHVLEHLTDLQTAIASLFDLLNDGGLAYIEVPDASRFADFIVAPYQDFNTEHINHFSLATLRRLMADGGFMEVEAQQKTVRCTDADEYPAIFGLWSRTEGQKCGVANIVPDHSLHEALERYSRNSQRLLEAMDTKLSQDLREESDIVVWGVGQLAMKLLVSPALLAKRIVSLVDTSPTRRGMHVGSLEIISPEAAKVGHAPIVIGSLHHATSIESMARMHFPNNRLVQLFREDRKQHDTAVNRQ